MAMDKFKLRMAEKLKKEAKSKGMTIDKARTYIVEGLNAYDSQYGTSAEKGFVGNLVSAIASPFKQGLKNIAGAGYEVGRLGAQKAGFKNVYYDPNEGMVQNPFLSQRELEQVDAGQTGLQNILAPKTMRGLYEGGVKPAAGIAAYAVPVGKAKALGSAVGLGMGAGTMGALGITPETATGMETAGRVGIGAAAGGVTAGALWKLNKAIQARAGKMTSREQVKELTRKEFQRKPGGRGVPYAQKNKAQKEAVRLVGEQNPVHQNNFTRKQDPMRTYSELMDYDLWNRDEWTQAHDLFYGNPGDKGGVATYIEGQALKGARPVDTTGVFHYWDDTIAKYPKARTVNQLVKDRLSGMYMEQLDDTGRVIGFDVNRMNPDGYLGAIRDVDQMRAQFLYKGLNQPTADDMVIGEALGKLKVHMENQLYNQSGLNKSFQMVMKGKDPVTGAVNPQTVQILQGTKEVVPNVYAQMAKATSYKDFRSVFAPIVRGNHLANASYLTEVSQGSNLARNISRSALSPLGIVSKGLGSRPVTQTAAKGLYGLGNVQQAAGVGPINMAGRVSASATRALPVGAGVMTPELISRYNQQRTLTGVPLPQPRTQLR